MRTEIYPVYSTLEVFQSTYELANKVIDDNIEGDFVECGVAVGSMIGQMSKANIQKGANKKVYGYDSFEGIPWATKEDTDQPGIGLVDKSKFGLLESTGIASHSLEDVIAQMKAWSVYDNVHLIKGWFQETIPFNTIGKICLLRLDGDMYESTRICLRYLYKKVSDGGIIIIDDYILDGCKLAVHELWESEKIKPEVTEINGTIYWTK